MTDLEVIHKIRVLLNTTTGITTEELSQVTEDDWQDILHADDVSNQIVSLINKHLNVGKCYSYVFVKNTDENG